MCAQRSVPFGWNCLETIESKSCVCVAGDSKGEDQVSLVLKQASDVYGEYQVGLTQA